MLNQRTDFQSTPQAMCCVKVTCFAQPGSKERDKVPCRTAASSPGPSPELTSSREFHFGKFPELALASFWTQSLLLLFPGFVTTSSVIFLCCCYQHSRMRDPTRVFQFCSLLSFKICKNLFTNFERERESACERPPAHSGGGEEGERKP